MKKLFMFTTLIFIFTLVGCKQMDNQSQLISSDLTMYAYGTGYLFGIIDESDTLSLYSSDRTIFYDQEETNYVNFHEIFEACQPVVFGQKEFIWTYHGSILINSEAALSLHHQVFIDSSDSKDIETIKMLYFGKDITFITKVITETDLLACFASDLFVQQFFAQGGPNIELLQNKVIRLINPVNGEDIIISGDDFLKKLYVEVTGDETRYS